MINVAIIGFGGIAKAAHFPSYVKLEQEGKAHLAAICDICPEQFTEKMEINIGGSEICLSDAVNKYTDWREMLKNEQIDMVDICLPTYLHAETTCEVLKMGYHVLCEKPMSLSYEECCRMIDAANQSGTKLMIGQCLRFSNKYNYLKKVVDENTFGKVKSGVFQRLSEPPVWGWDNWFMDYDRSHGCVLDMHIHDVDMIRYLFGEPESVSCCTQDIYAKKDLAHSRIRYPDFTMLAIGDWSREGLPFAAEYRVAFEKATVDYKDDIVTVYPRGGEAFKPQIEDDDLYYNEIKFLIDSIANNTENTANPPESAAMSVKLVNALLESSEKNGDFIVFEK